MNHSGRSKEKFENIESYEDALKIVKENKEKDIAYSYFPNEKKLVKSGPNKQDNLKYGSGFTFFWGEPVSLELSQ